MEARNEDVDGVEDGAALRSGVESVLGAVWVRVVIADGCRE